MASKPVPVPVVDKAAIARKSLAGKSQQEPDNNLAKQGNKTTDKPLPTLDKKKPSLARNLTFIKTNDKPKAFFIPAEDCLGSPALDSQCKPVGKDSLKTPTRALQTKNIKKQPEPVVMTPRSVRARAPTTRSSSAQHIDRKLGNSSKAGAGFQMPEKAENTANRRSSELRKRLNEWLLRRGISVLRFHHLKSFSYQGHLKKNNSRSVRSENSENKENVDTNTVTGDLRSENYEAAAKEALTDLHQLMTKDFPGDQCEAWLKLIKLKYGKLEAEPKYWMCQGALEQTRWNIISAVDCYKTAIMLGAGKTCVDEALDQLVDKFNLFGNNSESHKGRAKARAKILQDARNVFKSSIIEWAFQGKSLKK